MALTDDDKRWISQRLSGVEDKCKQHDRTGLYVMVFLILLRSCNGPVSVRQSDDGVYVDDGTNTVFSVYK